MPADLGSVAVRPAAHAHAADWVWIGVLALLGVAIGLAVGAAAPFLLAGLIPDDLTVPALFAVLCYWMLGQKWMNSNRLIITVLVLAIVLASLGIVEV